MGHMGEDFDAEGLARAPVVQALALATSPILGSIRVHIVIVSYTCTS